MQILRSPAEFSKLGPFPSATRNRRVVIRVPHRTHVLLAQYRPSSYIKKRRLLAHGGWCLLARARATYVQPHSPTDHQAPSPHQPQPLKALSGVSPPLLLLSAPLPQTPRGADQLALLLTAIADRSGFLELNLSKAAQPAAAFLVSSVGCSHAPYFYHGILMIIIHDTGTGKFYHGNTVLLPLIP